MRSSGRSSSTSGALLGRVQADHRARGLDEVHRRRVRRRQAREARELAHDVADARDLVEHRARRLVEVLVERRIVARAQPAQRLDRGADRRERIFDLVGDAASDLAAGRDALGRRQALAELREIGDRAVEGLRELLELAPAAARAPASARRARPRAPGATSRRSAARDPREASRATSERAASAEPPITNSVMSSVASASSTGARERDAQIVTPGSSGDRECLGKLGRDRRGSFARSVRRHDLPTRSSSSSRWRAAYSPTHVRSSAARGAGTRTRRRAAALREAVDLAAARRRAPRVPGRAVRRGRGRARRALRPCS